MVSSLMSLTAAAPPIEAGQESLLARAVSCRIGDSEIATLMEALADEDAGMTSPAQFFAAPSGNLYHLTKPITALSYSTNEIYMSPSRIVMVVGGQSPAAVSARLELEAIAYGPAERQLDGSRKIIAYQLHQKAFAGKVLIGCEYGDQAALAWFAGEGERF